MNSIFKRTLSILLVFVMCISMLPASALAVDAAEPTDTEETVEIAEDVEITETTEQLPEEQAEESTISEPQQEEQTNEETAPETSEELADVQPAAENEEELLVETEINAAEEPLELNASSATVQYSGTCGDNLTWTLDDAGLLTISGTGKMTDYSLYGGPFYSNSSSIKTVKIESGVTSIGNSAFFQCLSLTCVEIGDSVTSIGNNTFCNCDSMTSIEIPSGVTSIGTYAFSGCSSLTSIDIPSGVTSIGTYAFSGCSSLTSIEIPASVTSIGQGAFSGCSGLKSTTLPFVGAGTAICRLGYIFGTSSYTGGTKVGDYYIPSNLKKVLITGGAINNYAFENCSNLTSIELLEGVTIIGENVFYGCSSLTSIKIPEGVTSIGGSAFSGCSSLTSIEIPASMTYIGQNAFRGCDSLNGVYITDLKSWCGISFAYELANPLYFAHNLYVNDKLLTELTIPEGVTSIGKYAFEYCSSLTSIEIPAAVTSIGLDAFYRCTNLTGVYITDLKKWCEMSIGGRYSSPLRYGSKLYVNDELLVDLKIPEDVLTIGNFVFCGCVSLKSIEIPASVASIGKYSFEECSNLARVEIADGITSIGEGAFYGYNNLTDIEIPSSVTNIDAIAFYRCSSLTKIHVMGQTPTIASNAFSGVTATVCMHGAEEWEDSAQQNYGGTLTYVSHDYDYDNGGVTAPTCTEPGYAIYTCPVCGDVLVGQEIIPALGHDMVTTTVAPTCSAAGYDNHQCSRCEYYYRDNEVAKLSHKWQTKVVDPTCTEEGYTYRECSLCGTTTPHTNKTAALGHSFTDYVSNSDATCTQDGTKTAHCDHGCGATDTVADEGSAFGHTYGEWTDKGDGTHIRTCGDCSNVETESHHFEETSRENETCTETGLITYTCKDCGAVTTEVIPVHDHTLDVWTHSESGTRTHYSVCSECSGIFTEDCVFTDIVIQPTCRSQGYTNHVCNICGYSYKTDFTAKLDHAFKHMEAKEATCTVDGNEDCYICEECGTYFWSDDESLYCEPEDVIIPAKGHSYGEAIFTWSKDGKSATAECVCENDDSHILSDDAEITSSIKSPATCENMGITTYTATVILDGKQYTDTKDVEDIPALDHEWNETTYTWNTDNTVCNATRACKNDSAHVETATATVSSTIKTPATLTEKGWTTYTATFDETWAETQTKDVQNIPALGYKINYVLGYEKAENSADNPEAYSIEHNNITLSAPTLKGYAFVGWYLDKELTEIAGIPQIVAEDFGDKTFYARWRQFGDLNNDGTVNIMDVHVLRKAAAGLLELTDGQKAVADIYTDGRYNSLDVNLLRRYLAKIVEQIPYEPQQ